MSDYLSTEPIDIKSISKNYQLQGYTATEGSNNTSAAKFGSISFQLNQDLKDKLIQFAAVNQIGINAIFIAAINVILYRYAGNDSVFIKQSVVESGVKSRDLLPTAILNTEINGANSFSKLVAEIHSSLSDKASFVLDPITGDTKPRLVFIIEDTVEATAETGSIIKEINSLLENDTEYDLCFLMKHKSDSLEVNIIFDNSTVDKTFVAKLESNLPVLLAAVAEDPQLAIGSYNVISEAERKAILYDFNDTIIPYPEEKSLSQLFEDQVLLTPDEIALRKGERTITYSELNKLANRLAHFLITEGVNPADNIGLLAGRDFEMIIGMLGILKSGGAYVPIDPEYPIDRQEYIFNHSLLKFVIADADYPLRTSVSAGQFKLIEHEKMQAFAETNPDLTIDAKQLAYTIYTSGSTGRPKGVMIEHHSAVNLVKWVNDKYKLGVNDNLLFITSMCFDLSVYDIFGMLACGGTLVIAGKSEIRDVQVLAKMLVDNDVTFWDSVPTTLDYLVKTLESDYPGYSHPGLKTVFLSGDWIPVNLPDRIKKFFPNAQVVCLGGATEATVWSNYFVHRQTMPYWNSIPYGKPLANNFFYILNEQLQPVPLGTAGDLYIGGAGVARGYANDIDKTQRQFIPNPFTDELGGMMYKTGDLGRMMFDYNMEFIGRKDNQVKINGFRVELGEIESVLNNSGLVSVGVVLAKNDDAGNKRLVAYTVPGQIKESIEALELHLKKSLPDYMIPAIWVELDQLPLTANGKIDRNNLQARNDLGAFDRVLAPAETETEKVLLSIWEEHFKKDDLDVNSNFFVAGGHSLMAVQILSRLKKVLLKNYQLSILYKYPTIRGLAQHIDKKYNDYQFKSLVPIKPSGTKDPLYIIHGDGLNVLNFNQLAKHVDAEQPVYGLQAWGLNGIDEPIDSLPLIAHHYLEEILQHNAVGPYLLAGYSSGGYVAMEIRKQMLALGKQVKMLIIFDTDSEKTEYVEWLSLLPKKAKRHFPRLMLAFKMSVTRMFQGKKMMQIKPFQQKESKAFYKLIEKIKSKHVTAFRNYPLEPFDGKLQLYRAKVSVHYVEYGKYLGWEKYALQGVELYEIPGDHFSMLLPPHVAIFGDVLQKNLDKLN